MPFSSSRISCPLGQQRNAALGPAGQQRDHPNNTGDDHAQDAQPTQQRIATRAPPPSSTRPARFVAWSQHGGLLSLFPGRLAPCRKATNRRVRPLLPVQQCHSGGPRAGHLCAAPRPFASRRPPCWHNAHLTTMGLSAAVARRRRPESRAERGRDSLPGRPMGPAVPA